MTRSTLRHVTYMPCGIHDLQHMWCSVLQCVAVWHHPHCVIVYVRHFTHFRTIYIHTITRTHTRRLQPGASHYACCRFLWVLFCVEYVCLWKVCVYAIRVSLCVFRMECVCVVCSCARIKACIWIYTSWTMRWLRLVGSIKLQVSFAEYSLFCRALLQKRTIII